MSIPSAPIAGIISRGIKAVDCLGFSSARQPVGKQRGNCAPPAAAPVAKTGTSNARVIAKSGVLAPESSGDQIDLCYLNTVFELYSGYHLGQVIEAA